MMEKFIGILRNVGNMVERILDTVVFILVFSSIWLFCYLVFLRYVIKMTHDWGDALLQAMIVTGMVLAGAGASRQDSHTAVDFLTLKLKGRKQTILLIIQHVITILVCIVMIYSGIEIVIILKGKALSSATSVAIPSWVLYSMLPLSVLFCGMYYLEKLLQCIKKLSFKNEQQDH